MAARFFVGSSYCGRGLSQDNNELVATRLRRVHKVIYQRRQNIAKLLSPPAGIEHTTLDWTGYSQLAEWLDCFLHSRPATFTYGDYKETHQMGRMKTRK